MMFKNVNAKKRVHIISFRTCQLSYISFDQAMTPKELDYTLFSYFLGPSSLHHACGQALCSRAGKQGRETQN